MKRTISVLAVLLCMVLFRVIPAPAGLTASALQVLGIFTGALILWMTISIDWPSMLVLAALVTVPELTMNSVLAASLGNSTVALMCPLPLDPGGCAPTRSCVTEPYLWRSPS